MKNGIFRILAAAVILAITFTLAACGKDDPLQPRPEDTAFVPVSLIAVPVDRQETDQNGSTVLVTSLDIVEFTGGGAGAAVKMTQTYNDIFGARAQEHIQQEVPIASELLPQLSEDAGFSTFSQRAGVVRSDRTLFVLSVDTESYTVGAAHGTGITETVNFDPSTGDIIALSDIGVNGSDPTADLAALLAGKYMTDYFYDGYISDETEAREFITLMLEQGKYQWYLTDRFVLISNVYDLAPYAAGRFEISLSAAELKGIVDEKWLTEPTPSPNTRIYTGESDFDNFDMVYMVGDYGYEMNFVWFDQDVTNVYLTNVVFAEDGESFICGTTLDAHAELKKGEALLLDIMIPEGMPNTALSAEIDGRTYTWLIGYNGRDGGISFVETDFEPAG